jgi:recombinational DNA repair ATPase RecF
MGPKEDEEARAAMVEEARAKHTLHLKRSMGGFRGSFIRIITNSDRLIGFARSKDHKSLCLANELADYQVTLRKGYEKLSQAYILLLDDLPDDLDDDGQKAKDRYEKGRDEIDERYMDLS